MLDTTTKRRIDTARDILVGKVPDPKSQVEQITIALIYKFMDDMDAESEEFGGKRKFFAGEFARYGWAKLMRSGLGGHETLNVYAEAIARMPENPGIPLLFRDIFKNAYLPYRDPETLRAFLKIIDEFTYDHSERLGDAFEYLLSVLGSQGDAGQFRTPRHIIDFMVAVVDPKKTDRVLDPACGTAGFLISAYKHILVANRTDMDEQDGQDENKESRESCPSMFVSSLTPDEKGRLAQNFNGYDISPDMVRLSLVNLYLHGFSDPHIAEYDTLTSQDKWNETADVILANPPFMSPKGGIKPHNRFGVQSKRSEVLFVDYMAEHLTPTGRAGIIVPEGIIFQSQTAYKDLRKMLVENSLVAVVSLPAGVFNPYSGVKTSILILDKSLARQSNTIGFFKVENDGFGLGAQRREIDKNDLPQVRSEIAEYLRRLRAGETVEPSPSGRGQGEGFQPTLGLIVEKAKVAANGDYNLSGERYRENGTRIHTYPLARIADVCKINPPKSELSELSQDTRVSFVPMADMSELRMLFQPVEERSLAEVTTSYTYFRDSDVLFARVTPCFENGKGGIARGLTNGIGFGSSEFYILRASEQVLPEWLYFCVMHPLFREAGVAQMTGTGGLQRVPRDFVENFQIPLPPLPVQQEIVAEIEGYQKVIDGARAVLDNYRPHIPIHTDWPRVAVEDLVADAPHSMKAGPFGSSLKKEFYVPSGYKIYGQEQVIRGDANFGDYYISEEKYRELESCKVKTGDVLISLVGTYGKTLIVPDDHEPGIINPRLLKLTLNPERITPTFFVTAFAQESVMNQVHGMSHGGTMDILSLKVLRSLRIPLPPLATQQAIVAEIEAEQALVTANRELIARFERKIRATLARVWGEDEPAPAETDA